MTAADEPRHHPLCGYLKAIEGIRRLVCVSDCPMLAAQAKLPLV